MVDGVVGIEADESWEIRKTRRFHHVLHVGQLTKRIDNGSGSRVLNHERSIRVPRAESGLFA